MCKSHIIQLVLSSRRRHEEPPLSKHPALPLNADLDVMYKHPSAYPLRVQRQRQHLDMTSLGVVV